MKLYLSGGSKFSFSLDEKFIACLDKRPLMYIPIAIMTKIYCAKDCLQWIKTYFSKSSFNNIEMVTDLYNFKDSDFSNYSGLYIGGGNSFFLLDEMKNSGFYELLKSKVIDGFPVAGNSAGSIIHAKSIISAVPYDQNNVGLRNFKAYNHLGGFDLWCHYDSTMDSVIFEYLNYRDVDKIIALPDYCGLFVNNSNASIIGDRSAWIFKSGVKKELKSGEYFLLE